MMLREANEDNFFALATTELSEGIRKKMEDLKFEIWKTGLLSRISDHDSLDQDCSLVTRNPEIWDEDAWVKWLDDSLIFL